MAVVESFIPVPTTSLKLDGVAVTTSEGLAVREMVTIGDPETTAARAAVKGSHPSHGEYGLVITSLGGNASVTSAMNWHEQTV